MGGEGGGRKKGGRREGGEGLRQKKQVIDIVWEKERG